MLKDFLMASSSSIDSIGFALVDHTQSELLGTWKRSLCISGMEYLRSEAWTGNITGCIRVYSLTNATMRSIYSLVYLNKYNIFKKQKTSYIYILLKYVKRRLSNHLIVMSKIFIKNSEKIIQFTEEIHKPPVVIFLCYEF